MYSTEKLISEVQNYPCLWDMSSKEYSDKDLKKSCWRKVAEVVYSTNWNNFSSAEKEEKGKTYVLIYNVKLYSHIQYGI